jgi:hypothetical protein
MVVVGARIALIAHCALVILRYRGGIAGILLAGSCVYAHYSMSLICMDKRVILVSDLQRHTYYVVSDIYTGTYVKTYQSSPRNRA